MKHITIILAFLIAGITNIYSQTQQGLDYNSLKGKLEKSNKALENPKKAEDPKFWMERAKLFQDIADVNTQFLSFGIGEKQVELFYKAPKEKKNQGDTVQYIYDRFIAYFKDGKLIGWKETQNLVENPLDEALNAYNKATELDKDNKNTKKIVEGIKSLKNSFRNKAINCYSLNEFDCASESFKKMADISDIKGVNEIDTTAIYNAGFTALQAGKSDDAIKYLEKAAKLSYKGDPFLFTNLKKAYLAKGDTANALNALKEGIKVFPNDISIIIELVNFYITTGDQKAALEYLAKAKESDPKNRSFYYAEGALYDKMAGQIDDELNALASQKGDELKQLDENKKAEFRKTGNNVQKYKPIDEKYQKLKKAVEDKYKTREDSLHASFEKFHQQAVDQYKQAIQIDPNYFDAYYNLGVIYFNNGVKLAEQAGKEVDQNAYEAKKNAADEEFKKAVPYMESAYEVNEKTKVTPENGNEVSRNRRQTLDVLKNLYYRLRMNEQFDRIKKLQDSAQ